MLPKAFLISVLICAFGFQVKGQVIEQKLPEQTRILFLLDASGSMFGKWEKTLKIRAARAILTKLVDSLRVNEKLELALRAYGHQYPIADRNCKDTELLVPFSSDNHNEIIEQIRSIEPKGTTPIAYSLEQAASDFPSSNEYRNIIIIITDGVESCDGDPCSVSLALQRRQVFLRPFIIGLNMDNPDDSSLDCIGDYYDARDINDFRSVLNIALNQSLGPTSVTVELQNEQGINNVSDINVSFINTFTGESVYEFVHYRDRNGLTDTIQVDPVLEYNIKANTIPPVVQKNVTLTGGEHNTINLKTPQGSLKFNMKNSSMYKKGVKAIIRDLKTNQIYNIQDIDESIKYLTGRYKVEVTTLPKVIKNISLKQDKTLTMDIAEPGLVNLRSTTTLFGSLYQTSTNGEKWVLNLDTTKDVTALTLQPGNYKVAFRTKDTFGSKYTAIRYFTITSGKSTTINLNIKP